jgi:HSP20 family molecular chaperone IbpA
MEALDLSVEGDRLHLSIPALELQVSEGMRSVWRELPTQKRELRFQIPARVNHDAIKAHLKGDTLNIELPLTATQAHKIEIQGSRSL